VKDKQISQLIRKGIKLQNDISTLKEEKSLLKAQLEEQISKLSTESQEI